MADPQILIELPYPRHANTPVHCGLRMRKAF
jgi:hypothetical protein